MDLQSAARGRATVVLTTDELWTLRHCAIEAIEALGDSETEFHVRIGAYPSDVRPLIDQLKQIAKQTELPR